MRGAANLEAVLRDIARYRVLLVHGDDPDRVRAAADRIVARAAGSVNDAFAVTVCEADAAEAIRTALASPSFTATRRVVRVKDAGERQASVVRDGLAATATLLVLEAGALTARSRLLASVADRPEAAVILCKPAAAEDAETVRQIFLAAGLLADDELARVVVGQAAACGGSVVMAAWRAALLSAGTPDPAACITALGGDPAQDRLDLAVLEGMAGRVAALDTGLESALASGGSGIAWLRSAAVAVQRARGGRALPGWSAEALEAAGQWLARTERAAKTTGMPADLVGRMAVLALALGSGGYDGFRSEITPSS